MANRLIQALDCPTKDIANCLKDADAQAIVNASSAALGPSIWSNALSFSRPNWKPVLDKVIFKEQPWKSLKTGNFHKVPVLAGTNRDESRLFIPSPPTITDDAYNQYIQNTTGRFAAQIKRKYPTAAYNATYGRFAPYGAVTAIATDHYMACPTRRTLSLMRSHGVPAYGYWFTQVPTCEIIPGVPAAQVGASHFIEIPYTFQWPAVSTSVTNPICMLTPGEQALEVVIGKAWTGMASVQKPQALVGPNNVTWPLYPSFVELNGNLTGYSSVRDRRDAQSRYWNERCAFFDYLNEHETWAPLQPLP
ncbi:hypothetical protein HDV00_009937 [Rhizophlyctis rosea]|nr:hypothetical protein HDV00_009937 [Rhizophlyctis rosea]